MVCQINLDFTPLVDIYCILVLFVFLFFPPVAPLVRHCQSFKFSAFCTNPQPVRCTMPSLHPATRANIYKLKWEQIRHPAIWITKDFTLLLINLRFLNQSELKYLITSFLATKHHGHLLLPQTDKSACAIASREEFHHAFHPLSSCRGLSITPKVKEWPRSIESAVSSKHLTETVFQSAFSLIIQPLTGEKCNIHMNKYLTPFISALGRMSDFLWCSKPWR